MKLLKRKSKQGQGRNASKGRRQTSTAETIRSNQKPRPSSGYVDSRARSREVASTVNTRGAAYATDEAYSPTYTNRGYEDKRNIRFSEPSSPGSSARSGAAGGYDIRDDESTLNDTHATEEYSSDRVEYSAPVPTVRDEVTSTYRDLVRTVFQVSTAWMLREHEIDGMVDIMRKAEVQPRSTRYDSSIGAKGSETREGIPHRQAKSAERDMERFERVPSRSDRHRRLRTAKSSQKNNDRERKEWEERSLWGKVSGMAEEAIFPDSQALELDSNSLPSYHSGDSGMNASTCVHSDEKQ